ncbi:MAG: hypothetical protein H0U66_07300 [Gemmatimonadaceae bacterium]|nr:hypothetical protein [Gemmatimonadaceae bacterium]
MIAPMGGPAVAIILIKERHVAEAFDRAGAISTDSARAPEDLGVGVHGVGWRRLTNRAIMREGAPGRWYLDVPSWNATRRLRRQRLIILLALVLAVAAWMIYTRGMS